MINWEATKRQFGIDTLVGHKVGSKVVVQCDKCSNSSMVVIQSRHKTLNDQLEWRCPSCRVKKMWKNDKYKAKQTKRIKAQWKDDQYRGKLTKYLTSDKRKTDLSKRSKQMWETEGHRDKMSKAIKEKWKDDNYREQVVSNTKKALSKCKAKLSKISKKRWENPEYRKHTIDGIRAVASSSEYKSKMSKVKKKIWEDLAFREKMAAIHNDPEFHKKMVIIYNSPEYKKKMTRSSKALWKDSEYKEKMMAIYDSLEYKEKQSENAKALWKDPEYRKKRDIICNSPEYREKMAIVRSQQPRISSIQKILYSILDDLSVEYEIEKPIGYYTFDCFIPEHNILIECQGEYWHSLKENIRNDKAKATYIERYFPQYQLKCLWEHEFYAKDRITGVLKYWLGLDTLELVDFDFNAIEIRKVKHCDVKLLLSKYHYLQNAGSGGLIYGAYFKDQLIACCVFSSPTRKETATRLNLQPKEIRELSRFCIHPSYQKKNFGSWFISRCLKELKNYKLVVSFCDTTYNHDGALYKATNFKLDGKTKPDYWYVDVDGYVMHKKTLYQRATSMKMKEREYAQANNYTKVWGKEKIRFTKEL